MPASVQITVWCQKGDKPLSQLMVDFHTDAYSLCVIGHQRVIQSNLDYVTDDKMMTQSCVIKCVAICRELSNTAHLLPWLR